MPIDHYDPLEAPDAAEWLATDESVRIALALDYHTDAGIDIPNLQVHAVMHATVENQIALGEEIPVRRRLEQLMTQGLNRHQAVHAIASVLIGHMGDLVGGRVPTGDPNSRYYSALRRIDARKWLRSA